MLWFGTYWWDGVYGIVNWFDFSTYYRSNSNPNEPKVDHTIDTKGDYLPLASHGSLNLAELSLYIQFFKLGIMCIDRI